MKRWIAGILALLMATVFTACGNSGAEKPNTKDPADIARDIATAEVLGDTLATAYENGLPMAEDWLDLYFMGSSDPGPERRTEIEAQYPTNEELLYGISAADADAAGWYDIWYAVHMIETVKKEQAPPTGGACFFCPIILNICRREYHDPNQNDS